MHGLRIFCDVAKYHSFSQAAQEHGITQSAASQRVGQLEKKLGVKLINRSVRPLVLTAAGEEYLHGCQELLGRYDLLERRVSSICAVGGRQCACRCDLFRWHRLTKPRQRFIRIIASRGTRNSGVQAPRRGI